MQMRRTYKYKSIIKAMSNYYKSKVYTYDPTDTEAILKLFSKEKVKPQLYYDLKDKYGRVTKTGLKVLSTDTKLKHMHEYYSSYNKLLDEKNENDYQSTIGQLKTDASTCFNNLTTEPTQNSLNNYSSFKSKVLSKSTANPGINLKSSFQQQSLPMQTPSKLPSKSYY